MPGAGGGNLFDLFVGADIIQDQTKPGPMTGQATSAHRHRQHPGLFGQQVPQVSKFEQPLKTVCMDKTASPAAAMKKQPPVATVTGRSTDGAVGLQSAQPACRNRLFECQWPAPATATDGRTVLLQHKGGQAPQLAMNRRRAGMGKYRMNATAETAGEAFNLGTFGNISIDKLEVALLAGKDQVVAHADLASELETTVNQARYQPESVGASLAISDPFANRAGVNQGGAILNRCQDHICGMQGAAGKKIQDGTGIQNQHPAEAGAGQYPTQFLGRSSLRNHQLSLRGQELNPVFPQQGQLICRKPGEQTGHRVSLLAANGKHIIDGKMVIEGSYGDWKVLVEGLQVDGKIGRNGGFSDSTFFTGHGDHEQLLRPHRPLPGILVRPTPPAAAPPSAGKVRRPHP